MSTVTFWEKENADYEYNIIHHNEVQAKIKYVADYQMIDEICGNIFFNTIERSRNPVPIAIDIEWRPTFKRNAPMNPVSVIQLSTNPNLCYVFSIHHPHQIPGNLAAILDHEKVELIGCGIKNDCRILKQNFPRDLDLFTMKENSIELSHYILDNGFLCDSRGIAGIGREFLEIDFEKNRKISVGNWQRIPLTDDQIFYAAMDVYIPMKVYFIVKRNS